MLKDMTTGEEEDKELRGQNLGSTVYMNIKISDNSVRRSIKENEEEWGVKTFEEQ